MKSELIGETFQAIPTTSMNVSTARCKRHCARKWRISMIISKSSENFLESLPFMWTFLYTIFPCAFLMGQNFMAYFRPLKNSSRATIYATWQFSPFLHPQSTAPFADNFCSFLQKELTRGVKAWAVCVTPFTSSPSTPPSRPLSSFSSFSSDSMKRISFCVSSSSFFSSISSSPPSFKIFRRCSMFFASLSLSFLYCLPASTDIHPSATASVMLHRDVSSSKADSVTSGACVVGERTSTPLYNPAPTNN
mmetsp:Transcript_1141/g.2394  ORF Transcript_1141/g.2394 Transcript_1141/m.2394 type:complete len:249 (-) Transcript_1141:2179-2925(-)